MRPVIVHVLGHPIVAVGHLPEVALPVVVEVDMLPGGIEVAAVGPSVGEVIAFPPAMVIVGGSAIPGYVVESPLWPILPAITGFTKDAIDPVPSASPGCVAWYAAKVVRRVAGADINLD